MFRFVSDSFLPELKKRTADELLDRKVNHLDKGFVQLLAYGPTEEPDRFIAKFARASMGEEEYLNDKKNNGLINYLVEHQHTSPLEAGEMWFKMKVPIFTARQHLRHRTQSANELSLRYSIHNGDYYLPHTSRICGNDAWNKQGSGDPLDLALQTLTVEEIDEMCKAQYALYQKQIDRGVTSEIARGTLGTFFYTTIFWKMDTKNLAHLLSLRRGGHAQEEIRELAEIVYVMFKACYPALAKAYEEFVFGSTKFSKTEMEAISDFLSENYEGFKHFMDDRFEGKILGSKRRYKDFMLKTVGE